MNETAHQLRSKVKAFGKNERGFTLVELVIVCVILVIILGAIATVVSGLQANYNLRRERTEQINDGAASLDLMTRVIRVAGANTSSQAMTPTGTTQLRIRADWNPLDGTLTGQYEDVTFLLSNTSLYMRNETTNQLTELTGSVNALSFQYFDSSGNVTATPSQIARVKITLEVGSNSQRSFSSTVLVRKGVQIK